MDFKELQELLYKDKKSHFAVSVCMFVAPAQKEKQLALRIRGLTMAFFQIPNFLSLSLKVSFNFILTLTNREPKL